MEVINMVRKILLICSLCLLLISVITLNEFFMDLQYINTFRSYVMSQLKIPYSLIDDYNSDNIELNAKASEEIIRTTLKNIGYEHWNEYLNYIELKIYKSNVLPTPDEELIVVLNLSKDLAVIAVYSSLEEAYVYKTALKDILPIETINFLKAPEKSYNFLVTEQILDERFGAFFVDQFVEIYLYEFDHFNSVFKKSKYLQEVYNFRWINPDASSDRWLKIIENNDIRINEGSNLNIDVSIFRQKLTAIKDSMPLDTDYSPVEEIITEERYYWSPKYSHFAIFEGRKKNSTTVVAVIDDTAIWRESFLGLRSNNYQVKTIEGEVIFIDKNSITTNID